MILTEQRKTADLWRLKLPIHFTIINYKEISSTITLPDYHKSDYITMKKRLKKIEWTTILRGGFTDSYQKFLTEMENMMSGCISSKTNGRKKKNNYKNKNALRLNKKKERSWKKYKRSKTFYDCERYVFEKCAANTY